MDADGCWFSLRNNQLSTVPRELGMLQNLKELRCGGGWMGDVDGVLVCQFEG